MKPQQLPRYTLPEVAFVGRSNTGKSTLLNVLTGHKNLARTSRTPGRTQMVNFFDVNGKVIFADLPGYGWSAAVREVASQWQALVDAYIQRDNIRDFLFLMDCRRKLTGEDLALMEMLGRNLPLIVVVTKTDKLSREKVKDAIREYEKAIAAQRIPLKQIIAVSALKKTGIPELRKLIIRD